MLCLPALANLCNKSAWLLYRPLFWLSVCLPACQFCSLFCLYTYICTSAGLLYLPLWSAWASGVVCMSLSLSVYLNVCASVCLSVCVCLSVSLSKIRLPLCLASRVTILLCICLLACRVYVPYYSCMSASLCEVCLSLWVSVCL